MKWSGHYVIITYLFHSIYIFNIIHFILNLKCTYPNKQFLIRLALVLLFFFDI